jgi:positive regulator of sigma E activity
MLAAVMYVVTAGTGMQLIIELCSTSSSNHQCSSSSQCAEETAERVNGNGNVQSFEV